MDKKQRSSKKGSKNIREEVLSKCWQYIYTNFNRFKEADKIRISLELCKKEIPQEVKGDLFGSAETAKAIANLSSGDLERFIAACRERKSAA